MQDRNNIRNDQESQRGLLRIGYTSLHAAALFGDTSMVATLLGRGAGLNRQGEYGETPPHLTLSATIHNRDADLWAEVPNYVDEYENKTQEYTDNIIMTLGNVKITLLNNPEVDITIQDAFGRTCLYIWRYNEYGENKYVARVLEKIYDINIYDYDGQSAVYLAA